MGRNLYFTGLYLGGTAVPVRGRYPGGQNPPAIDGGRRHTDHDDGPVAGGGVAILYLDSMVKILVLEDEFLVALAIEEALQAAGYQVVGPIARLDKALELIEREPLDGALLDVNIQGGAVFPVADRLLALGVPMVFTTGDDREDIVPDRFRASPRLAKPFDFRDLTSTMGQLFGQPG